MNEHTNDNSNNNEDDDDNDNDNNDDGKKEYTPKNLNTRTYKRNDEDRHDAIPIDFAYALDP